MELASAVSVFAGSFLQLVSAAVGVAVALMVAYVAMLWGMAQ